MYKKIFKGFVIASFALYGVVLYYLLFCFVGRQMVIVSQDMLKNYNYWNSINLIPFKTISQYIMSVMNGDIKGHALMNLAGNLLLLFPLGFYLPFFTCKLNKVKIFLPVVVTFIVVVEIIQVVTRTGSFDIDDIMLNLIGALTGFFVFKYTPFRSLSKLRIE